MLGGSDRSDDRVVRCARAERGQPRGHRACRASTHRRDQLRVDSLDWTALAFTFGLVLAVGLLFGLAPALHATRSSLSNALKEGDAIERRVVSAFSGRRFLVVVEVAMALVLLAGSGLMLRSLTKVVGHRHRASTRTNVSDASPHRAARRIGARFPSRFLRAAHRTPARVPGVTNASDSAVARHSAADATSRCSTLPGQPRARLRASSADRASIGSRPDYFATLRVPLKRGRMFTDADRHGRVEGRRDQRSGRANAVAGRRSRSASA